MDREELKDAVREALREEVKDFAEVVHRMVIIFDDFLCLRFGFSRKPRGKYIRQ